MRSRSAGMPERGDIADAVTVERGVGGRERALGRRRAGLADLEMDDGVARRFLLGGSRHDIHDDERIDRAAAARELARHRSSATGAISARAGAGRIDGAAAGCEPPPRRPDGTGNGVDPAALPADATPARWPSGWSRSMVA